MLPKPKRRTLMEATGATALLGLASGPGSATRSDSSRTKATDVTQPRNRFGNFSVEFDDNKVAGWKTVTIPSVSIEQGTYREGNEAPQEKKVAGQPSYDDLEMERGVKIGDATVWDWVNNIRHGKVDGSRREIGVNVMDNQGTTQTRWEFTKCWPKEYTPPQLDASADGQTATEQLTVAFDKMIRAQ